MINNPTLRKKQSSSDTSLFQGVIQYGSPECISIQSHSAFYFPHSLLLVLLMHFHFIHSSSFTESILKNTGVFTETITTISRRLQEYSMWDTGTQILMQTRNHISAVQLCSSTHVHSHSYIHSDRRKYTSWPY